MIYRSRLLVQSAITLKIIHNSERYHLDKEADSTQPCTSSISFELHIMPDEDLQFKISMEIAS